MTRHGITLGLWVVLCGCGSNDAEGPGTPDASLPRRDAGGSVADAGTNQCAPENPNSCAGETICLNGTCVPAFGRTYTIGVWSLTAASTKSTGEAWDAGGGAPDPFVEVLLNDQLILTTDPVDDVFSIDNFNGGVDVVIPAGAKLDTRVWDDDLAEPDFIMGCLTNPLTADVLRLYGPACDGTAATGTLGSRVELVIVPKG